MWLKEKRRDISSTDIKAREDAVRIRLWRLIEERGFREVLIYYPLPGELNLLPSKFEDRDLSIYFPRVTGRQMQFLKASQEADFEGGPFGTRQPK